MKKLFLTAALALGLTTAAASAADFDRAVGNLELYTGNFAFKLDTEDNLKVGYFFAEHENALGFGTLYVEAGVNLDTEETTARVEYSVGRDNGSVGYYVAPALEYRSELDSVVFDPYAGVTLGIGGVGVSYVEVGTTIDLDGGVNLGSWAEVGVDFSLTENTILTPAIVHSFDVPGVKDETQLSLSVAVVF